MNSSAFENVYASAANWNTNNQKFQGCYPPKPYLTIAPAPAYEHSSHTGAPVNGHNKNGQYTLLKINSQREPYAVQYLISGYGGMDTRLGTRMGSS